MWKPEHRLAAADRSGLRYPSDLIDAEWVIIEPMIPTRQARRPQAHDRCARDSERHFLRAVDGLPMAGAAQGPAAEERGMGLFRSVHIHGLPTGAVFALKMRPTTAPFASTSKSSSFHRPDNRFAEARLRMR
jgi:hypothetical protein